VAWTETKKYMGTPLWGAGTTGCAAVRRKTTRVAVRLMSPNAGAS
jgi:hypothetical protein